MHLQRRTCIRRVVSVLVTAAILAVIAACGTTGPAPFIPSEEVSEPLPAQGKVEVRYIANEGVLISSGDKRVLIDGLHRRYEDAYPYLPDQEREKIETAKPPFENIDLVLVSHMHGDHFHPEAVGRYLQSNKRTVLATSQQVVGEIAGKFAGYDEIKGRITPVEFKFGDRTTLSFAGIEVEFLGIGHGTGRHGHIQNLGHIFTVGNKKFLHLGDPPAEPAIFDPYDLDKAGIDIAFIPAWFLTSEAGRAVIRDHIKPRHIIAVHVGPHDGDNLKRQIAKDFPTADVFATMLEKKYF